MFPGRIRAPVLEGQHRQRIDRAVGEELPADGRNRQNQGDTGHENGTSLPARAAGGRDRLWRQDDRGRRRFEQSGSRRFERGRKVARRGEPFLRVFRETSGNDTLEGIGNTAAN